MLLSFLIGDLAQSEEIPPHVTLAAKAIQLPEGFHLDTVACEPNLANPVAFCFDPKGRIFVAETYRVKKGVEDNRTHMDWLDDDLAARTVADRRDYVTRHKGDNIQDYAQASEQVRLLEDRDADGFYEYSSVYSQDYKNIEDGVAAGVMWVQDGLWFTCIPALWELRDEDADGQAEQKRVIASGFGVHTAFYGHDLHGLCQGPDGKIYFSIGDRGLNVETANGRVSNPDSGAVLRCNPDGTKLEIFATGLRNPQELAFNELGDLFTVDNNSDYGDRARLIHLVEGMDAGWRMSYQYLPDRGPWGREKIWELQNGDQPASVIPPLKHISDGPSGLVYYPGTGMPTAFNDEFFLCDFRGSAGRSGVRHFSVEPQGATYKLDKDSTFITGVLATDCDFGPTGELFILDWIDGWNGTGLGRIHRITCDDPTISAQRNKTFEVLQKLPKSPTDELITLLGHVNMRVRIGAQQRLVARGLESASALKDLAVSQKALQLARLHAIWALGELAEAEPQLFATIAQLRKDENAEVRAQAAKTLGRAANSDDQQREESGSALLALLTDSSPRVRCFAAISMGKLRYAAALPQLLQLARESGGDNPTLRHAAALGLAGSQSPEALIKASVGATVPERLTIVVALGKQKSSQIATLLNDEDERVVLEAARVIWDKPLPEANNALASLIAKTSFVSEPLLRRVLAANIAGRTPANLQAVIDFGCRADVSPALRELAWDLVRNWASPSPRDSVYGDWRPLEPRPKEEVIAAIQASIPQIIKVSVTNPAGLIAAAEMGLEDAYPPLIKIVNGNSHSEEVRARGLAAFKRANESSVKQVIEANLHSKDALVRSAALRLLVDRFPTLAVTNLLSTIEEGTVHERQAAFDMLGQVNDSTANDVIRNWMDRLEKGTCAPELQIEVLEAAGRSNDSALVERKNKFTETLVSTGRISAFSGCLSGGDSSRGKKLFDENTTLSCRRCHSVKPGEILVGPNLANVGGQRTNSELLESIVNPNAKITEGFDTVVLLLDSGKVATGVIRREDSSQIILVDAEAKEITIEADSVEERTKGNSSMPDNLVDRISQRELRDLIAYLSQLRVSGLPENAAGPEAE